MPVRICVPIFSFLPSSVWAQWPWKVSVDSRPSHCPRREIHPGVRARGKLLPKGTHSEGVYGFF